jgi:hypothetical protein
MLHVAFAQKSFAMRCHRVLSLCVTLLLLLSGALFGNNPGKVPQSPKSKMRFIVTGGLEGVQDGYRPFYEHQLFRLGTSAGAKSPFVIDDSNVRVWRTDDTVFFSDAKLDAHMLVEAGHAAVVDQGSHEALAGHAFFGIGLDEAKAVWRDLKSSYLKRELAAYAAKVHWERRDIGGKAIYALAAAFPRVPLRWPTNASQIYGAPGVIGREKGKSGRILLVARPSSSTARVFGVIDSLLHAKRDTPTRLIDIGGSLGASRGIKAEEANRLKKLFLKRDVAVMGTELYDFALMAKEASIFNDIPALSPIVHSDFPPRDRTIQMGSKKVQFLAIDQITPDAFAYLPKDVSNPAWPELFEQAHDRREKAAADLVFAITNSSKGAAVVSRSPIFDAVLTTVSGKRGALASENINFADNIKGKERSMAPEIKISPNQVTELEIIYRVDTDDIESIQVTRHELVDDGPMAQDAKEAMEISNRAHRLFEEILPMRTDVSKDRAFYGEVDFDNIIGAVLLRSSPEAEIALVDKESDLPTPIFSGLSRPLAETLLSRPGQAVTFAIWGKSIKKLFKLMQKKSFEVPFVVVGGTLKGPTINKRAVINTEMYTVIATEKVFNAIVNMVEKDLHLMSTINIAAVIGDTIADKEPLKSLEAVKRQVGREEVIADDRRDLVADTPSVSEVVAEGLKTPLSGEQLRTSFKTVGGESRHTFALDLEDLELGFSMNQVNNGLSAWQNKEIDDKGHTYSLPENRLRDATYFHLLINAKLALQYFGPYLDSELLSVVRYSQTEFLKTDKYYRPVKDKVAFDWSFRIPLERMVEKPREWTPTPLVRFSFDTSIWPNAWMSPGPEPWLPRILIGRIFVGSALKPLWGKEVLRAGVVYSYNFNKRDSAQASDLGGEISGDYKWFLGPVGLKLETVLRWLNPFVAVPDPDKLALYWDTGARVDYALGAGFSVVAFADGVVAQAMNPVVAQYGTSIITGLALSYGNRFKWLP